MRHQLSFAKTLTEPSGSDGVDPFDNPLEVSISTNSSGPLNIVATVCSAVGSGALCLYVRHRMPCSLPLTIVERRARATTPTWPRARMCK